MLKWRTVSGSEKQSTYDATRRFRILPVLAGFCLLVLFGQERSAHALGFADTGSMGTARRYHAATLLNYSGVLVTGGYTGTTVVNSAELYNPGAGTFTPITATMNAARRNHTATLLNNGRVLIVGGYTGGSALGSAEIYNPSTRTFSPTGSMVTGTGRWAHTATLLNDGKVLIAGGRSGSSSSSALNTAEIYDPATGSFTATGTMKNYRSYHTATLLNDGRVLIAGGFVNSSTPPNSTNTAEIFDPTTGQFTATSGSMTTARGYHAAVLLNDGTVLVTGGAAASSSSPAILSAEIFTPAASPGTGSFASAGNMRTAHSSHTATFLFTGDVLIAGSWDWSTSVASNAAEVYTPGQGFNSLAPGMNTARGDYPAVLLANGTVLLAGGITSTDITAAAEVYNPSYMSVAPVGYAFPNTVVNGTSPPQSFTINNEGITDLTVSSITISGGDSAMFALSGSCGTIAAGESCTVTVTFKPTSTGIKYTSLFINTSDAVIPNWEVPLSGTGVLFATSTVTVTFAGSGSGSVHSSPAGIACSGGSGTTCQSSFTNGTTVTLIPTADSNSLFDGWSGACTNGTGDCVINNLSANRATTATFNYINPAKIVRNQVTYPTLMGAQGAYTAALNGDVIQTRAYTFAESPNFTGGKTITINGGYNLTYAPGSNIGNYSVISGGSFTIGTGQITLSNIIIQ